MIKNVVRSHTRFNLNMARIAGLMKLATSGDGELKPTHFMTYEGVGADIFRLIVVFLHATVEDLVRSQLPPKKQFSFQSGTQIDKELRRAGFDSSSLKPLYPPLTGLAKRRNRIVHGADLASSSSTIAESWGVEDLWQLIQWNLAVIAFYYQMLILLTEPRQIFIERYNNARKAMDENVKFANQLISFPKEPLELQLRALEDMHESLCSMFVTIATSKGKLACPPMTLGNKRLCLAALAVTLLVTACSDYERFHGRTPEQAKQACEPQRQTSEECARTLDK